MAEVKGPMERFRRVARLANEPSVQPTGTPPDRVAGGLGVVPAAPIDTTRRVPEPRSLSPKDAQALMLAELLGAVRDITASATELTARIGRQGALNGVLDVFVLALDAAGHLVQSYPVTVGSIVVTNHHATDPVMVVSGPESASAPTVGRGLHRVDAGRRVPVPIGGRQFTLWGTAAALVSVQVYTGLQPIGGSL